jgi:hypothetical protein
VTERPHDQRHFIAAEPLRTGQYVRVCQDGRVESCTEEAAIGLVLGDAVTGERVRVHLTTRHGLRG